jgi:CBS domain-containing protein
LQAPAGLLFCSLDKGTQEGAMKVRDVMTRPFYTCKLDTSLDNASRKMNDNDCGTLIVLDHRGRPAGILTDRDLAIKIGQSARKPSYIPAHEVMTREIYTCSPDETLRAALKRMSEARVRRLPVVTPDGDLQGLLSIDDIILWGVKSGGVTQSEVVEALRSICAAHTTVFEDETIEV